MQTLLISAGGAEELEGLVLLRGRGLRGGLHLVTFHIIDYFIFYNKC